MLRPASHHAVDPQRTAAAHSLALLIGLGLCCVSAQVRSFESVLAFSRPTEAASASPSVSAVSANFHYFVASDPLSVRQYQGDWQGNYHPRDGRNIGLLTLRSETGAQAMGWRLSAVRRTELLIDAGRGMTDLERLYKTRQAIPLGQVFDIDINYAGYEAKGWRLDKAWNWKPREGHELRFGLGYSLLEGTRVRSGNALGTLTGLGGGNYTYSVRTDDANTRKTYPFLTPGTPEGNGSSVDLGLEWKTPQGARFELVVNDLLGRMRWSEIPGTVSNANTGVTGTDANGYIVYAPALSGRNARRDFTQKLPLRWGMSAELPWRDFYMVGSLSHLQHTTFPLLALGWRFADDWRVQGEHDFRFKTYGLKLAGRNAYVELRASQRDLTQANAYGVSAGASWSF